MVSSLFFKENWLPFDIKDSAQARAGYDKDPVEVHRNLNAFFYM